MSLWESLLFKLQIVSVYNLALVEPWDMLTSCSN